MDPARQSIATFGDRALQPLPPGQVIPGTRYRILARVGAGAMGEVYAAEHIDLGKRVALKTLLAESARKPESMERFREEARTASMIGSPFICDVTDFGQLPDGRVFYVMEYLDGQSLRAVLKAGPLSLPRVIALLRQICKALGAAHEKGVIHLDVKPDNVVIVRQGRRDDAVKVVDFGLAGLLGQRLRQTDSREQTIHGTPEYVAPERIRGAGFDRRSDIYSLGAMAYEMLTGRCPFEDDDIIVILRKHVVQDPVPPRQRAPDREIPPDLERLVLQMLDKEPQARPQTMAVVEALLCEAQIATRLQTAWDDLELPAVDEAWQRRLTDRMPSPRGRKFKRIAIASSALGLVAASAALYFGAFRAKEKEFIKVEVTQTEEDETVAPFIARAHDAFRAERFVRPEDDSALFFIGQAEAQAEAVGRPSKGAERLRQLSASALAHLADQLARANLHELARAKFREALLFLPDDPKLAEKAQLSEQERRRHRATRAAATAPSRSDAELATAAAGDLFQAAQKGRLSLARQHLGALQKVDRSGARRAGLADAIRGLAASAWAKGARDDARGLYQILADLDPRDPVALERAAAAEVHARPAPAPAPPAPSSAPPAAKSKRSAVAESGAHDDRPRDPAASKRLAREGALALEQGRLSQAEDAYNKAVSADPGNAEAIGGLAEVAFERARYPDALDYARRASRVSPKTAKHQITLGDAYFKLLRYDEAIAAYERAAALAPNDIEIKRRIARSKTKLGSR